MPLSIVPEPSEAEREAIVAALAATAEDASEWGAAALVEAVDVDEPEP